MRIIKLCHAVIGLVGMIFGTTNAKKRPNIGKSNCIWTDQIRMF